MVEYDNPLLFLTIKSIKRKHLTDDKGRTLIDFSTQGYLGFDHNQDILKAQIKGLKQFGNVVPWARTVAVFDLYAEVEKILAELVGSEETNLFLSTTLLNHGVISALAGHDNALIAFEQYSHMSSFEGALLAKAKGAKIELWSDKKTLESILESSPHVLKLIVTDGVYPTSGSYADLPSLDKLAKKYDAILYVDDAHGFGVVGEMPSHNCPYGKKGNGLVRYFNLSYDNILYVGCFSKAYGLPGAFIACTKKIKNFLLAHATPHDLGYSGQASTMVGLLKAMEINKINGEITRDKLYKQVEFISHGLERMGFSLNKKTPFPIVTIAITEEEKFINACKALYKHGILVTPEPFISTPQGIRHLLRITITHGLTHKDLRSLLDAFSEINLIKL